MRERLPNRRPNLIEEIDHQGKPYVVCVGLDPNTCRIKEVFVDGIKSGSDAEFLLDDAATIVSIALQSGVEIADLAKSLARVPIAPPQPDQIDQPVETRPATPIGAVLDHLIDQEASLKDETDG